MSNDFRPGMKVVCVDDSGLNQPGEPRRGQVFTITVVYPRMVNLAEITHLVGGYFTYRFRLAADDNEKLAVFRAMLSPDALKLAKLDGDLSPYPRRARTPA